MSEQPQTAIETMQKAAVNEGVVVEVMSPKLGERVAAAADPPGTAGAAVHSERGRLIPSPGATSKDEAR